MKTKTFRYFLHMAYNGKEFFGWQIQKNGPSVQATVNEALTIYFKKALNVAGCGRTDTGVHAKNFYAHIDLDVQLKADEITKAIKSLNGILPSSIVIYNIRLVKPNSHTRFNALSRTYQYHIVTGKDPFFSHLAHNVFRRLDLDKMNQAASLLLTIEDFTSFSKLHTQVNNNLCKVNRADWKLHEREIIFTITANRFLRNMVRAIVGTLMEVGLNKIEPNDILKIAQQKDRSAAGPSVPAQGLFLTEVRYPPEIFLD